MFTMPSNLATVTMKMALITPFYENRVIKEFILTYVTYICLRV